MRIIVRSSLLGVFVAALLVPLSAALAAPEVLGARIGSHPGKTRFVLELSEPVSYRVFTLPDPFRVVIDLPQFAWSLDERDTPSRGGQITGLRHGLFAPGTSRVVLDVRSPVKLGQVFFLPPRDDKPHRFVIDITPITRQAYFAEPQAKPLTSAKPLAPPQQMLPEPGPAKPPNDPRPVVVVDAGHGGVDPGAKSISGMYEKDLTLIYAKALRRALLATGRYRVVLTRDRDRFVKLRDRIRVAEEAGGNLFISLHANNHESQKIRGASVYTLSENASDKEAARLAAAENSADTLAGLDLATQSGDVRGILIDLAQRESMNLSKQFANSLVQEVGKETKLLNNSHRFAGFAVLKSPTVPSILFEIGYLSHRKEEWLLRDKAHREKILRSIIRAIDTYFAWQRTVSRS